MKEKISLVYALLVLAIISACKIPTLRTNFLVLAETATESNQPSQQFKENLEKIVAEKIKDIIEAKAKRGWVGTISAKDETSIKIEIKANEVREVLLDTETTIISAERKIVSLDDLVIGKRILAMGYLNGENLLLGKRIQILDKSESKNRFSSLGVISDKSINQKIITLTQVKNKDLVLQLNIDKQTEIKTLRQNRLTYENLSVGDKIATVYQEDGDTQKTILIMVLSPTLTPIPEASE